MDSFKLDEITNEIESTRMQTDGDKSTLTIWTKQHVEEVLKGALIKKKGKLIDFGEYLETKALKTARL